LILWHLTLTAACFRRPDVCAERSRSVGAEVRLRPNGSIIRIGPDTTFRLDELQRRSTSDPNQFSVYAGKVRIVAARIRGTDFVVEVRLGLRETILVRDGSVEVFNKSSRQSVIVDEGEWTDVLDDQSDVLDWDDEGFEDDFLDEYEWDDEYLEEEFFDDETRDFETDYSDHKYEYDYDDDYDDDDY